MRICIIHNLFPPYHCGGAERVVELIIDGIIQEQTHELLLISSSPRYRKSHPRYRKSQYDIVEHGFKIYRFFPFNLYHYLDNYKHNVIVRLLWHFFDIFNLHSYFVVKKILRKEKPDLVWTHNLKGLGYLIPLAIKQLGLRHYHTVHDVQLSVPSGLIIKGNENAWEQKTVLRQLYEKINRCLFGSPDIVISPSHWLMDFYTSKGFFSKSRRVVLPNPVAKEKNRSSLQESSHSLSEKQENNTDIVRFLFVGQIEWHKGVFFLADVFKQLLDRYRKKRLQLDIVGSGSQLEKLKSYVKNVVGIKIWGRKNKEELDEFYARADYVLVPSLCYENSPTVIYESLSLGTSVIAADIGGVSELIRDMVNGYIFKAGDKNDLYRVMEYAIENPIYLEDYRLEFQERYSIKNYLDRILRKKSTL